jgi:hypothetical protein
MSAIFMLASLYLVAIIWMPSPPMFPIDGPARQSFGYFNYLTGPYPIHSSRILPEIHGGMLALSILLTLLDVGVLFYCFRTLLSGSN